MKTISHMANTPMISISDTIYEKYIKKIEVFLYKLSCYLNIVKKLSCR